MYGRPLPDSYYDRMDRMGEHATHGAASGGGGGEEDVYYPSYEEVDEEDTHHRSRERHHSMGGRGGGGGGDGLNGDDGDEGVCGEFELIPGIEQDDHDTSEPLFDIDGNDGANIRSSTTTHNPDTLSGLSKGVPPAITLPGVNNTTAPLSDSDDDSESGQPTVTTNLKKMKKSLWRGLVVCLREDMSAVGRIVMVEKGNDISMNDDDDDDDDDNDDDVVVLCHIVSCRRVCFAWIYISIFS